MSRTIKHTIIALACAMGLAACASTVELSRKDMLQQLQILVALEDKHDQLKRNIRVAMVYSQGIPDDKATRLKEHNDVYWVHHAAANVAVANGNMESYEKHVEAARREVEAMDAVVNEWSRELVAEAEKTVKKSML